MKKLLLLCLLTGGMITCIMANDYTGRTGSENENVRKENPFAFFNAHRQGYNTIGLMWRFKVSSNVLNFQIQRSYDGEFFNTVAHIQNGNHSRLSWKDDNVLPGYIYYRLIANLADGSKITSNVEIVHIVQK